MPTTISASSRVAIRAAMASPSTADMVLDSIDRVADGVKAGTNVTIKETGNGPIHKTVLTFDAMPVTLTDQASTVLYGGQKVYDFPDGLISILGCVADLDVAVAGNLNADADGDVGIGTVTASNNATLATTEQNICPTTAIPQLVASAGTSDCQNAAAIAPLDGTGTAVDVFLNYVWDDADHNGGSMTVTGTITIIWVQLGDN